MGFGVDYGSAEEISSDQLRAVARRIFTVTFGPLYEREAFAAYCDRTYSKNGPMDRDLADASIYWRVASISGEPIGYAKLRPLAAPAPAPLPGAMELQQLYVVPEWQGKRVAEELMLWAVERAKQEEAPELYLTVFDHNSRAKRFYSRHGFSEVGRCTFTLGDRIDDDRIWRKPL